MSFNHPLITESNTTSSESPSSGNQDMQDVSVRTQPSAGIVPTATATTPSQVVFSLPISEPLLNVNLLPHEVLAVMQARSASMMMQPWSYGAGRTPTVATKVPTDTSEQVPFPVEMTRLPTVASVSPAVMNDLVEILSSAASARASIVKTTRDLTCSSANATSPEVASLSSTRKTSSSSSNVTSSSSTLPGPPGLVKPRVPPSSLAALLSHKAKSSPNTTVTSTSATDHHKNNVMEIAATTPTMTEVPTTKTPTSQSLQVQQMVRSPPDQMEAGLIDTLQHTVMQNMKRGPSAPIFIHPLRSPIPVRPRQQKQQQDPSNTSLSSSSLMTSEPFFKKRLVQPFAFNKRARTLQDHRAITARALEVAIMVTPNTPYSTSSFSRKAIQALHHPRSRATKQQYLGPSLSACYNRFLDIIPHHPSPVLIPFLCLTEEPLPSTKSLPCIGVVKDDSIKQEHPIQTPGRVDILFGRGRGCSHHMGNLTFRRLIDLYHPVFASLSRGDRPQLVRNLVQYVRWQGGRFLTRLDSNNDNDPWYECGDEKAHRKVSQALRDSKNRWKDVKKASSRPARA